MFVELLKVQSSFMRGNTGVRVVQFRQSSLASAVCDVHFVALALRRTDALSARSRVSSATLVDDNGPSTAKHNGCVKALLPCCSDIEQRESDDVFEQSTSHLFCFEKQL